MKKEKMGSFLRVSLASFLLLLILTTQSRGASIEITDKTAEPGDGMAVITIELNEASKKVRAFGFDINYGASVLKYSGYERGELVSEFLFFDVYEMEVGVLRVGGVATDEGAIKTGESGRLLTLTFKISDCKNSVLEIVSLKDDLKSWETKRGVFKCLADTESIDNCPEDPNKTDPGVCGCGVADNDSDEDGALDCIDACPNDPDKTAPGDCGCGEKETDTDGDGVSDCKDMCPDDPAKTSPGDCGCNVPDTDTDGDGTKDCKDACPNDPAKTDPGHCGCGEKDTDTDGDGVADCKDACPGDPAKVSPGDCGCGIVDDANGDGVSDCNENSGDNQKPVGTDNCPNDPNKTEPGVCGCNVEDTDTDLDGLPDCIDDDADGNGVKDAQEVENDADLDGDGNADNKQSDIKSFKTVDGNGQAGIKIKSNVAEINSVASVSSDSFPNTGNRPDILPFGLIDFTVTVEDSNKNASVIIYFSEALPGNAGWHKYDKTNGWMDYSDHATFSEDRKSVSLTILDGGMGDVDGQKNGVIVDPSGPGYNNLSEPEPEDNGSNDDSTKTEETNTNNADGGGGSSGCFIWSVLD